jgi:putative membrane protein
MLITKLLALLMGAAALLATSLADAQPQKDIGAQAAVAVQSPQFFISQTAIANLLLIQSAQLALDRAENDPIKKLAATLVEDHRKLQFRLREIAEKAKLKMPHELDQPHKATLERLSAAGKGAAFERLWIETQSQVQQEALQLHAEYAKKGDYEELKLMAGVAKPVLENHVRRLNELAKP